MAEALNGRPMRKSKREVAGREALSEILAACDVCRVALNAETPGAAPYVVPLNFGFAWTGTLPVLYFHCAPEGRKLDLLRANPRAGFEAGRMLALRKGSEACRWSSDYESVIGTGTLSIVDDPAERLAGLEALMRHYGSGAPAFDPASLERTTVLRLDCDAMSGKRLAK
jgi:nitroimidazol reductase NimA-like FMN-containing flavoprotein (pyridoxamine 5'-phosphate oxidase superfamily)